MKQTTNQEFSDKLGVSLEIVERRLGAILNAVDSIDSKTNLALGFASTILVILGGLYSLSPRQWPLLSLILFILALVAYIALVVLSVLSYRVRDWSYRPEPSTLLEHCENEDITPNQLMQWIFKECESACKNNLKKLSSKSKMTNLVLMMLAAETLLLAVGLVYGLFGV